jgi:hypothetical protein
MTGHLLVLAHLTDGSCKHHQCRFCRLYWYLPSLLVQMCNGTTAGLGYLEVNMICPCESPHWAMDQCPHCRSPWGEWLKSSADFNPNHNHVNADPKRTSLHTTSRPLHHAAPSKITVCKMYSCQYQSQSVKIINQKEWHMPPII